LSIDVVTTTPILGGGARTRELDHVDIIRVPTIRGHLRFWWRALNGHLFPDTKELFAKEAELWGHAGDESGGRSRVDVRVEVSEKSDTNSGSVGPGAAGAYALWPAREQRERGIVKQAAAARRNQGTRFRLDILMPQAEAQDLAHTVRAWILFGGYGSRTRRGVGSLTVCNQADKWLPDPANLAVSLNELFGRNVFAPSLVARPAFPVLADASVLVGRYRGLSKDPWTEQEAWLAALGWLRAFRQEPESGARKRAPKGSAQPDRHSISNWPEADKVRHLSNSKGLRWAHAPRHNITPVWPRAGFGLPIIGRFQQESRVSREPRPQRPPWNKFWNELPSGHPNFGVEPRDFEIGWADAGGKVQDRMASPLIVKALPTLDGFLPCAIWLNRSHPPGQVGLIVGTGGFRNLANNSTADFDQLRADGDPQPPLFAPLHNKRSLRQAFLDWVEKHYKAQYDLERIAG
jgi:CRISPR-associated protein Cmr1